MPARHDTEKVELTAALLSTCVGLELQAFPKEYPVYVSPSFKCYAAVCSALVLVTTGFHVYDLSTSHTAQVPAVLLVVVLNVCYFAALFLFVWWWFPTKITRTVDSIVISFKGARDRVLPLDAITEIRALSNFSCTDSMYMCKHYACRKVFWGVPSSMLRRLVIITNTCCANYQVSMTQATMREFIRDNSPADATAQAVMVAEVV
jgi:hypothetical protein